jgi:hypothetical protein
VTHLRRRGLDDIERCNDIHATARPCVGYLRQRAWWQDGGDSGKPGIQTRRKTSGLFSEMHLKQLRQREQKELQAQARRRVQTEHREQAQRVSVAFTWGMPLPDRSLLEVRRGVG